MSCNWHEETVWQGCSHIVNGQSYHNASNIDDWPNCKADVKPSVYTIVTGGCITEQPEYIDPGNSGGGSSGGGGGPAGNGLDECTTVANNPGEVGIIDENGCHVGGATQPNDTRPRQTPCADLNRKSTDSDFLDKMEELSADAGGTLEAGLISYNTSPRYGTKKYGAVNENSSFINLEFDPSRASEATGLMHCHLNITHIPMLRTLTVFSMSDFDAFAEAVKNSIVPAHLLAMYVTSNRGTFALKVTDKQAIIDFADYINANEEDVFKYFEKNIDLDMSKEEQIKGLLKLIKKNGPGIELYESDANFKNWKKHYLDSSNELKDEKC